MLTPYQIVDDVRWLLSEFNFTDRKEAAMSKFWITFIINEAMAVLGAYIASSKLTDVQKAAAEKLVADGEAFLATL